MILGVDIGGTFTDVVCAEQPSGLVTLTKVTTNYTNITESILTGMRKILTLNDADPAQVERMVIGTTVATNVIVQRRGAKVCLLTTAGFEDVLEIGRLKRRVMYDLNIGPQTPVFLAPHRYRVGVPERVDASGSVVMPLDEALVVQKVREMKARHGIEAVAVSYLFSFENPAHELRTRELIEEACPELPVSLSCEVNPFYREYERTVVTTFDAYVRPKVEAALEDMERQLREFGIRGEIHIMQSNGGVTTTHNAARRPVNLFLSGPAGGAVGAAHIARISDCPDSVTIDIGGTSSDVAVIEEGVPAVAASGEIAGFPVRVPMVEINTIGSGGGSIIEVDASGMMRVGPASAGSEPGPACYGRGGTLATITDASLLLGYLNPKGFAGGEFDLDRQRAERAMQPIAEAMGLTPIEAALGAHRIMNVQMAEQIRSITIKRGYDPRRFTLIPFGGAGPIHAGALASMLEMQGCVIPPTPGVLSAYGLLNANVEIDTGESFLRQLGEVDVEAAAEAFAALRQRCIAMMEQDGMSVARVRTRYLADLRYSGQDYEITVPLRDTTLSPTVLQGLGKDFASQYERMYGHTNKTPVEVVNLRCVVYEIADRLESIRLRSTAGRSGQQAASRDVWFLGADRPMPVPIHRRENLRPGSTLGGPAIVEQADTTILVYPGQTAEVDSQSNLRIVGISGAYTS